MPYGFLHGALALQGFEIEGLNVGLGFRVSGLGFKAVSSMSVSRLCSFPSPPL